MCWKVLFSYQWKSVSVQARHNPVHTAFALSEEGCTGLLCPYQVGAHINPVYRRTGGHYIQIPIWWNGCRWMRMQMKRYGRIYRVLFNGNAYTFVIFRHFCHREPKFVIPRLLSYTEYLFWKGVRPGNKEFFRLRPDPIAKSGKTSRLSCLPCRRIHFLKSWKMKITVVIFHKVIGFGNMKKVESKLESRLKMWDTIRGRHCFLREQILSFKNSTFLSKRKDLFQGWNRFHLNCIRSP